MENLPKLIAMSGLCSRRQAEETIRQNRVKVNGNLAILGQKAEITDVIEIDGKLLNITPTKRLIAFHKPINFITSHDDEQGRRTIFDILPREFENFHYIGRLDFKSSGLLLLTNSPALKESFEKGDQIRGYKVKIEGNPDPRMLQSLANGITIDEFHYKGIKCEILETLPNSMWLKVHLTEGKNREIRRIFDYFGHPVLELIRFSYGLYQIKTLEKGKFREEIFPKI